ncbi:MAG: glycosyltransferase [Gallionella sp.]
MKKISEVSIRPSVMPANDKWDKVLLAGIWLFIILMFWIGIQRHLFNPWLYIVDRQGWQSHVFGPAMIWLYMATGMLIIRTLLWIRYRPFPTVDFDGAPPLTVIIPAFNEGPMVSKTIESCVNSDYPKDRLEIIAVDDGSTDDTWTHILATANRYPNLVKPLRFAANQGKRAALLAGFELARGEIVVTIDSDSIIDRNALREIASPFREPKIGAVGGKVVVFNRFAGIIPRMLHVRFVLSFDFLRSAQSVYRTVYCCPGALSAYRASVLKLIVPGWSNQKFLGQPCTIGEDRALTNDVLNAGFDTVYQRTAVVHTVVPHTYKKLCRMYLRWDRSYIREELRLARIVWRRPIFSLILTLMESTLTNLRFFVAYSVMAVVISISFHDTWAAIRFMESIGIAGLFYALYFVRSERSWEFGWGVLYAYFSTFALFWIFPFALLTVRSRSWLTR